MAARTTGIVHFGPGAFFRSHQASYVDALLACDARWGIGAVALKSTSVRDALAGQDGLYTLSIADARPSMRIIGALTHVIAAPENGDQVRRLLAAPATRLVTATVTEKGYCLTASGDLDVEHPDIRHDLMADGTPISLVGWLVDGYRARRAAGLPPFTAMSCDNISKNGEQLRRAVLQFAQLSEPGLAHWIAGEARFPATMVDCITPATDDMLRDRVASELGLVDAWPIQREAFAQWVIEDSFCDERPALDMVGATFTGDVAAFERAKLRLLNGAHSSLAYIGLLLGYETVAEAMTDPALAAMIAALMRDEIAPTLRASQGFDLSAYVDAILERFRNPTMRHQLSQIAWDGSQKLPYRLFGTIGDRLEVGAPFGRLALAIAAWMRFIQARARQGTPIVDPLAGQLAALGRSCTDDPEEDVGKFLALTSVFPAQLTTVPAFRVAIAESYAALANPASAVRRTR